MINLLVIIILYLLIFFLAEFLYYKNVKSYITRKIVHIGGGLVTALLPWFVSFEAALTIGTVFTAILLATRQKNILKSIHENDQGSIGAYIYPLTLTLCALLFWNNNTLIFQGAVLILALSDGLAALIGNKVNYLEFSVNGRKTLSGSITFFIVTILILWIIVQPQNTMVSLKIIFSTLIITSSEAVFGGGWDNLFIVLSSGFLLNWLI